ncbi:class I SAM-dependent methyltransferase [Loigolactobacillus bifermentans]|nr:class I SAM-dependent methyltransferase [Loigolactobacillus bifermentans]QGG59909.1 N-6 DNA methylase [Loigolactobacillus bifermentans]
MGQRAVEQLYKRLDTTTALLKSDLEVSYLDALIETSENILAGGQIHVDAGLPHPEVRQRLTEQYQQIDLVDLDPETIRQAFQLAILRGEQTDALQANHQMTPDTIGMLMAYLIDELAGLKDQDQVLDLTIGTGNLLYTVLNRLKQTQHLTLTGFGVDNDDTMLALADVSARLQQATVTLYHQDAIDDLVVPQVDLSVSDLPVGYYPVDQRAEKFDTHAQSGHSFAHHLLIEQSMCYTKPAGFGFFLVPSLIFQSEEAKSLTKWMTSATYMQGLLNLPRDLFQDQRAQKAILILQNKGGQAKQAPKVLLGEFPSLRNQEQLRHFMAEISAWQQKNIV